MSGQKLMPHSAAVPEMGLKICNIQLKSTVNLRLNIVHSVNHYLYPTTKDVLKLAWKLPNLAHFQTYGALSTKVFHKLIKF